MVQLTSLEAWGIVCGIGIGLGLWSLVSMLPRLGRPRLMGRVAPYLGDVSPGAREYTSRRSIEPLPLVGAFLTPAIAGVRTGFARVLGGTEAIELRLRQAGTNLTAERFRARQLVWTICGAAIGAMVSLIAAPTSTSPIGVGAGLVLAGALGGLLIRDQLLRQAARRRLRRIIAELPTTLEFLTLSLSAGEGVLDSLRRVGRTSNGEFARELLRVVSDVNTGVPLAESLRRLDGQLRSVPVSRVVDHIVGTLERGTPLAEVLRAQAQDARDESKRELLEAAGKKEVAMLVPLVFLILPVTVIFAIYPGIIALQLGVQ